MSCCQKKEKLWRKIYFFKEFGAKFEGYFCRPSFVRIQNLLVNFFLCVLETVDTDCLYFQICRYSENWKDGLGLICVKFAEMMEPMISVVNKQM